ncbi:beta-ketoadipate enol-lactone hydrolase [Vibrio ishigakensis]|uniref:Beta-ketoadipate enol-lactone hydrolase n=1 Tax=Vibrio ishigakensis TaxID=1481914 RepID=A0A0B8PIQ3_9VIBR|nr:beta-ketoadipate enol-lactone hydrolase [Vibrio ishigakensis]
MSQTPLIWLPGLLCDQDLFADMNAELPTWVAPQTAKLGALDSMQAMAKKVLDETPQQFVLGGLSMGGILAFEVYRQAPDRVKGLILMDTNAADEKPEVSVKRDALVERAENGEFEAITPEVLMPVLIHESRLLDAELTQRVSQMAENIGLDAFKAHAKALATRPDQRPLLSDITCPTLVITGKQDALCPMANHLLMAEHISDVSLHVIPECGHLSSMEKPPEVASIVSDWLERKIQ